MPSAEAGWDSGIGQGLTVHRDASDFIAETRHVYIQYRPAVAEAAEAALALESLRHEGPEHQLITLVLHSE